MKKKTIKNNKKISNKNNVIDYFIILHILHCVVNAGHEHEVADLF